MTADTLPPGGRRARVLVVDDEPGVGIAMARILKGQHDVVVLQRAAEALELLGRDPGFDLIFCDLMMPEMNGMEFHRALQAAQADTARRVVFMTGGAFTDRSRAFLDAIPNERLEKPFDRVMLRAFVADRLH